jgi:hypothetical protein
MVYPMIWVFNYNDTFGFGSVIIFDMLDNID